MLESCRRPELVTEITMQPVRRYGVDAAILYSDIVVPLAAIGVGVEIVQSVGPVIGSPIKEYEDLARLRPLEPDDVPYIVESVRMLHRRARGTPLIGFGGAPFTLAYLPGRGWAVQASRENQGADVWQSAPLARARSSGWPPSPASS